MVNEKINNNDNITNKLLLNLDKNFDNLYNKQNYIDYTITNKNKILYTNNEKVEKKDKLISYLLDTIKILVIFILLSILNINNIITFKQLTIIIVLIIVIYIIRLIYIYFKTDKVKKDVVNKSFAIYKGFEKLTKDNLNKMITPYECNDICIGEEESPITPIYDNIISNNNQPLRVNDPTNVWLQGDIPEATMTTDKYYKDIYKYPYDNLPINRYTEEQKKENEPKPWFRGILEKGATYYECLWKGNNKDVDSKYNNIISTIPCDYMINYKLVNKYICNDKPTNKDELSKCNKIY